MKQHSHYQRNIGFFAFFFSGICAISSGVIVSRLQETYGFAYGMTGTLLSLMNIGNLLAGFAAGVLPGRLGMKKTALLLTAGYGLGYSLMGLSGWMAVLMLSFFLAGVAKGSTINFCTILVSGHSENRARGMNLMHSCYAMGALLCPFVIAAAAGFGNAVPMAALAFCGLALWLAFASVSLDDSGRSEHADKPATDWSFLKSRKFWLLTGLLFCQNAAETSVTGWMVTYFKGSGIISGQLSPYTVTVMWGATLTARLLIAFVVPLKNAYTAMIKMSLCCIIFYIGLMAAGTQTWAILLLFAFAFSMAGMNPTAVACAGHMTNVTSMGVMLPAASSGAILMPWIIGIIAESAGIRAGMASNIIPCVGMLVFCGMILRQEKADSAF